MERNDSQGEVNHPRLNSDTKLEQELIFTDSGQYRFHGSMHLTGQIPNYDIS